MEICLCSQVALCLYPVGCSHLLEWRRGALSWKMLTLSMEAREWMRAKSGQI